ncbi:hypothetical protein H0H93_004553 [Arthromyces matolae]|nr:hypothetical protein H0H93_004553 [Arthromyces matolae]
MPSSFGSGIEKVGMRFGSLSLGRDSIFVSNAPQLLEYQFQLPRNNLTLTTLISSLTSSWIPTTVCDSFESRPLAFSCRRHWRMFLLPSARVYRLQVRLTTLISPLTTVYDGFETSPLPFSWFLTGAYLCCLLRVYLLHVHNSIHHTQILHPGQSPFRSPHSPVEPSGDVGAVFVRLTPINHLTIELAFHLIPRQASGSKLFVESLVDPLLPPLSSQPLFDWSIQPLPNLNSSSTPPLARTPHNNASSRQDRAAHLWLNEVEVEIAANFLSKALRLVKHKQVACNHVKSAFRRGTTEGSAHVQKVEHNPRSFAKEQKSIAESNESDSNESDDIDYDKLEVSFDGPTLNEFTLTALEYFLTDECLVRKKRKGTAQHIQSGFVWYFDHMSHGAYSSDHFECDPVTKVVRGNPARSKRFRDLVRSVKNRDQEEGIKVKQAEPILSDDAKQMISFSERVVSEEKIKQTMQLETRPKDRRMVGNILRSARDRAILSLNLTLWARNFEMVALKMRNLARGFKEEEPPFLPYMKATFDVRKGKDEEELINRIYFLYPRPSVHHMDAFYHCGLYLDLLSSVLGRDLEPQEVLFPVIRVTGQIEMQTPLNHDYMNTIINKLASDAGIDKYFTTHSARRGGVQYVYFDAPRSLRWPILALEWWGGWAKDAKSLKMLQTYLFRRTLDLETDYGRQLRPMTEVHQHPEADLADGSRMMRFTAIWELEQFGVEIFRKYDAGIGEINQNIARLGQNMTSFEARLHARLDSFHHGLHYLNSRLDTIQQTLSSLISPSFSNIPSSHHAEGKVLSSRTLNLPAASAEQGLNPHPFYPVLPFTTTSSASWPASFVAGTHPSTNSLNSAQLQANHCNTFTNPHNHTFHTSATPAASIGARQSPPKSQPSLGPSCSTSEINLPRIRRGGDTKGWRQIIENWTSVDPRSNIALKDWTDDLHTKDMKYRDSSYKQRKRIFDEHKKLGEAEFIQTYNPDSFDNLKNLELAIREKNGEAPKPRKKKKQADENVTQMEGRGQ